MKQINFIKALSPDEQYALTLWYYISSTITCIVIIGISIGQAFQWYTYAHSKRAASQWIAKQASIKQTIDQKYTLLQEKLDYQNRLSHIQKSEKITELFPIFEVCIKTVIANGVLQSLSLRNNYAVCIIKCSKPADAIIISRNLLAHSLFKSVTVTQLRTDLGNQRVQATIRAAIKQEEYYQKKLS